MGFLYILGGGVTDLSWRARGTLVHEAIGPRNDFLVQLEFDNYPQVVESHEVVHFAGAC